VPNSEITKDELKHAVTTKKEDLDAFMRFLIESKEFYKTTNNFKLSTAS